jgi:dTDP-4-dehydrorhamnose 3,5-epimerase
MYTFVSTCIADFTSDSVGPWITNTIQDHKNEYLPYSKFTCMCIVQAFSMYTIIMGTIHLFVALSQIDFMMMRMSADLLVNYYTTSRFMQFKSVNAELYHAYLHSQRDSSNLEEHMFVVVSPAPATAPMSDSMDTSAREMRDLHVAKTRSPYEASEIRDEHLQNPHSQGKLVSAVMGEVFDVAVDVRVGSPRFGQWVGVTLSDTNHRQLWVPPGFAHGFVVTSEEALFHYKCTDLYHPECEMSVLWNDPAIGIEWPVADPTLNDKDGGATALADFAAGRLPVFAG